MSNSDDAGLKNEIERLSITLDLEIQRSLDLETRLRGIGIEFENFVSMAAHNLRESLRDVASFSQLLAETSAGSLDTEARMFLDRIRDGADKMQSLLAAVVDYWAMNSGDQLLIPTDMEAVLRQALLYPNPQSLQRSAIVTHDPLPEVMADFGVVTKVLQHLIGNAIEYCDGDSPVIHISSKRDELVWVLSVRDNGPGIDPTFQDRVFQPFVRLHGKEHPGNGLGLAFCRKAIERFGGRMWLESTPGAGCTFYVTLCAVD